MLRATSRLLELIADESASAFESEAWFEAEACCDIVLHFGSAGDSAAVLPCFLESPRRGRDLLPILQRHGNVETGRRLYEALTSEDGLHEEAHESVLHAIGYLGYQPAAKRLLRFAEEGMHHLSRAACFGLLDLHCEGLEGRIGSLLRSLKKSSLFPEFLPSLAVKTADPAFIDAIMELGEATSADNVAGVMLGVAAFGELGKPYFERFLCEPSWEGDFAAAGTPFALVTGAFALGFKPTQVFENLRKDFSNGGDLSLLRYRFACLLELIEGADTSFQFRSDIPRSLDKPRESAGHIVKAMFGDDCYAETGIYGLAKALQDEGAYRHLEAAAHRVKTHLDLDLKRAALLRALHYELGR
jgi:hypothetical protein